MWLPLLAALMVLSLATIACGATDGTGTPATQPVVSEDGNDLQALLATGVLRTGTQRVAFVLHSSKALIEVKEATVSSYYAPNGNVVEPPFAVTQATYYQWPYGTRGNYVTELRFDKVGSWMLDIEVVGEDGANNHVFLPLTVAETSPVVDIGQAAPHSRNKTLLDVDDIQQLTTAWAPDPELYLNTIERAVTSQAPALIVFASPAYCTSPTCGPEVETLQGLKEQYKEVAFFIHVEVYDNPDEIGGDLNNGRITPVVDEWGISDVPHWKNESWAFITDRDGIVTARFEGYATAQELEEALLAVLQ
ncbi:MAG: thioredoxin family protein [Chloroflexi bacterium]|nr:thioredoxin family protein [Chloroflexota bacterium]